MSAQPGNDFSGPSVYDVGIIVLYLKVIVGAVVEHHLVAPGQDAERIAVYPGLYQVNIARKQTEGPVHVVVAELRRLDKTFCKLHGPAL